MATWSGASKSSAPSWASQSKPIGSFALLLESGSYLLLENSGHILLESGGGGTSWSSGSKSSTSWTSGTKS